MEEKLDGLIGQKFSYNDDNIIVEKWKRVNSNIVIYTNKRTLNFFSSEIDQFISDLKPEKMKTPITKKILAVKEENDAIKQLLFEAIDKVKTDRTYVQQANAICNITSQLIKIKLIEMKIK